MGLPLQAIRQMVRDRIGVPPHDEFFSPNVLDTNINLALTAIESEHRWPWNETAIDVTLDSSGEMQMPDDWRATRAIWTRYNTLVEVPYYDLKVRFSYSSGEPTHFSIVNQTMHVRPWPSGDIQATHLYYAEPKVLVSDTDTPNIPMQHIGTLIAKAAQLCSVREDDRPSADVHRTEYSQGIERMRKEVHVSTRPTTIRVREGSWT